MVSPTEAATVILLREERDGFAVFLTRRHGKSAFMGGAHVFPGGKLDPGTDRAEEMARWLVPGWQKDAERLRTLDGRQLTARQGLGYYVAACRELFEEAGVLLARDRQGDLSRFDARDQSDPVATMRQQLNAGTRTFASILVEEGLRLDLGQLRYWAHWITPDFEPRRYDTRFFVARLPPGQEPCVDHHEATEQVWLSPTASLQASASGDIVLPPPTLRNIEDLESLEDLDQVFAHASDRAIGPVQPKIGQVDGKAARFLPWDPDYQSVSGGGLGQDLCAEHPMACGPSRIVLEDGRWVSRHP